MQTQILRQQLCRFHPMGRLIKPFKLLLNALAWFFKWTYNHICQKFRPENSPKTVQHTDSKFPNNAPEVSPEKLAITYKQPRLVYTQTLTNTRYFNSRQFLISSNFTRIGSSRFRPSLDTRQPYFHLVPECKLGPYIDQ